MDDNVKMNSIILFLFFVCLNKILKMHKSMRLWGCTDEYIDSIWNCFFYENAFMLSTWEYMNGAWNFRWQWILWDTNRYMKS